MFLLLHPLAAAAAESLFSYDPAAANGPANWALLDIPNNACGGSAQSGIDIPYSGQCDRTSMNYIFSVRNLWWRLWLLLEIVLFVKVLPFG